ncbi:DNA primase catalytic subunit PriS, partial [Acidiplasma aeolicum]|uniref:DNA primase catalytic subunit PriS n=2 Tax=Acidiplasma TaxID=507753 RepID=UPI0012F8A775
MEKLELRDYFRDYYVKNPIKPPDLLFQREIGYIPFNGSMVRHRMYNNNIEIERFVKKIVPRHLYYSSAYYRHPEITRMQEKEWLGAELIFDLDADHIEGANKMTYAQILDEVKKHTLRLINVLMDDFGFTEDNIHLYFSGGRGYHVHIESDAVYQLDSDARREIGDYIRIEGINIDDLKNLDDDFFNYGILKKLNNYISEFYENIDENIIKSILGRNYNNYINYLQKYFNGKKIIDFFTDKSGNKFKIMDSFDAKNKITYNRDIFKYIIENFKKGNLAEIDEPVTTDIHRLIRFPLSLHGKTGLMVKPLKIDYLRDFNPLNEAIPDVFKEKEKIINIKINKFEITMNNEHFILGNGEHKVP